MTDRFALRFPAHTGKSSQWSPEFETSYKACIDGVCANVPALLDSGTRESKEMVRLLDEEPKYSETRDGFLRAWKDMVSRN